jgi:hypothetical protein
MPETVNGPEDASEWDVINWAVHEQNVARLRQRIFTAARDGVPLGNSVSCCELGFCCGISGVAGTISRCCCRSSTAC